MFHFPASGRRHDDGHSRQNDSTSQNHQTAFDLPLTDTAARREYLLVTDTVTTSEGGH